METSKKVPAIRFKVFEEEWERKKLWEICNNTFGGGTPSTVNKNYWTGDIPWIQSSDLIENRILTVGVRKHISQSGLSNSAVKLIPGYSIAVITRVGVGKLALIPFQYTTSQDFLSLSNLKIDALFGVFSLSRLLKNEAREAQGTSIKGITKETLLRKKMIVPPRREEQAQIGNFFKELDGLIHLQEQKLEKVSNLKKAMLEKMFPKEGADVPEVRFKGFSDKWEKKSLGEVSDSFSGGTPSVGNRLFYGGEIPFIRSGEINSNQTELFISDFGLKNSSAKMIEKGDILYALYGATSGEVGISEINGAINQAILAIKPIKNYNSFFIAYFLRKEKEIIINTYLQGGQGNLSGNIVKGIIIKFPSLPEQQKIGAYFQNLDQLITQAQEKIKKLKNLKQALLQKMFI